MRDQNGAGDQAHTYQCARLGPLLVLQDLIFERFATPGSFSCEPYLCGIVAYEDL